MESPQFSIGNNRIRPPYVPKGLCCPSCNAPISMYSEQSQLVVCDSCGQNLDCSKEELIVLGKTELKDDFVIRLGQEFLWKQIKYKVIARMMLVDQWKDITVEHLLFHPFDGTKWLSVYKGEDGTEYFLSENKRASSLENPFEMEDKSRLRTGDFSVWKKDAEVEMSLFYVDGSLPWLAKVGDQTKVIEYKKTGAPKDLLSVEHSVQGSAELEYSFSKKISERQYLCALKLEDSEDIDATNFIPQRANSVARAMVLVLAILGLIGFGVLSIQGRSEPLTTFSFSVDALKNERGLMSPSFTLSKKDVQYPLILELQVAENSSPSVSILKVPKESKDYVLLETWSTEEESLEESKQTMLEEAVEFYINSYDSRNVKELFGLKDEGHYRLHLKFDGHELKSQKEPVVITMRKGVRLRRYYILMFFCSIWTLIAWRKL
jgi:hypothetical protein